MQQDTIWGRAGISIYVTQGLGRPRVGMGNRHTTLSSPMGGEGWLSTQTQGVNGLNLDCPLPARFVVYKRPNDAI